jgi:hypothetical protein
MNDNEFVRQLQLILVGKSTRIRDLEEQVARLTVQLAEAKAKLVIAPTEKE